MPRWAMRYGLRQPNSILRAPRPVACSRSQPVCTGGQCVIGAAGIVTRSLCSVTLLPFKFQFIDQSIGVTFLCPNKKVTKEVIRGEALRAKCILAPDPTPAAFDHRPLKISRFSVGSAVQTFRFAKCKHSKIGTFLNAGWRCGWGYLRGRIYPKRPLGRLLWGTFLAETRKVQVIDKHQFDCRAVESGRKAGFCTV